MRATFADTMADFVQRKKKTIPISSACSIQYVFNLLYSSQSIVFIYKQLYIIDDETILFRFDCPENIRKTIFMIYP